MRRVLFLSAVLSLGFAPAPLPRASNHRTPRACFLAYIDAQYRWDLKAYVACLTDDAIAVQNAYLMSLAAKEIRTKRDNAGELLKVMAKHYVPARQFEGSPEALYESQLNLTASKKTPADWDEYDLTSRAISAGIKDQAGFMIDVMGALAKGRVPVPRDNRDRHPADEYTFTKQRIVGRYAALTAELQSGLVVVIRCVRSRDGWKMMSLPESAGLTRPLPTE